MPEDPSAADITTRRPAKVPALLRGARRARLPGHPSGEHFTGVLTAVLFSGWQSPIFCCSSTTARIGTDTLCGGVFQGMVISSVAPGASVVFVADEPMRTGPPIMSA